MKRILLIAFGLFLTSEASAQEQVKAERCNCKTVYYSQSGYGKLQTKTHAKTTTKKGCLNHHKRS